MTETALEDRAKIGTQKPTGLERIVNVGKNALSIGLEVLFPFMYSDPAMRVNAMVTAYPLSVGSRIEDLRIGKSIDNVKAAKESFVGTIMTPAFSYLFKYIEVARQYVTSSAGSLAGGAAAVASLAGAQAVFAGAYTTINHVIQKFSFKGLYEKLKKDYWPTVKRMWTYVLPLSSLNVLWLYKFGIVTQLAYASLMTFLFRLVGPKAEGEKYKTPAPAVAGANA